MKCPHCRSLLDEAAVVCGGCGFSARTVRSFLGGDWVRLERITDKSQKLSLREFRDLETSLDKFERLYPQCFFAIYLGPLPDAISPGVLGFWMLNHGAFQSQRLCKCNDFGIALVVDTLALRSALTVGYALERYLPSARLGQILEKAASRFRQDALAAGIEGMIRHVSKILRNQARSSPPLPQDGPLVAAEIGALGFEPLKNNQRTGFIQDEKLPG